MDVRRPHDVFFKQTFGKDEVARSFLETYLPAEFLAEFDIMDLKAEKDSFVTHKDSELFSDLLFSSADGLVCFLFEHKSSPDRRVAFQLYGYMYEILKKQDNNALTFILPIVISQGRTPWSISPEFGPMIKGYADFPQAIKKHIPNFEYYVFDVTELADEEIQGSILLQAALELMRDIFKKNVAGLFDTMARILKLLQELDDAQSKTAYFETMIRYVFHVKSDWSEKDIQPFYRKIESIDHEGSQVIMTIADELMAKGWKEGWEEGWKEGLEKGLEEAIERGQKEQLLILLRKQMARNRSDAFMMDTLDIDEKQLAELKKELQV